MLRPRKKRTNVAENVRNRRVESRETARTRFLASTANQFLLIEDYLNEKTQNDDSRFDSERTTTPGSYSQTRPCYTGGTQFVTAVLCNRFIADKCEWVMHKFIAVSGYVSHLVDNVIPRQLFYRLSILFLLLTTGVWTLASLLDMYATNTSSSSNQLTMSSGQIKIKTLNGGFLPAHSSFRSQSSMNVETKKEIKLNNKPEVYAAVLKEVPV